MIEPYHTMEQDHAFLDRALHFIQITWLTHIFANILRVSKWVQFAGCNLNLVTWALDGFLPRGAQVDFSNIFLEGGKNCEICFFPLETTKTTFFRKFSQSRGGPWSPCPPFRRPCPVICQFHPVF